MLTITSTHKTRARSSFYPVDENDQARLRRSCRNEVCLLCEDHKENKRAQRRGGRSTETLFITGTGYCFVVGHLFSHVMDFASVFTFSITSSCGCVVRTSLTPRTNLTTALSFCIPHVHFVGAHTVVTGPSLLRCPSWKNLEIDPGVESLNDGLPRVSAA